MKQLTTLIILLFSLVITAQETIQGRVIFSESKYLNGNIITEHLIETSDDNIKTVITKGGVIGLEAEVVSDEPTIFEGQIGYFEIDSETYVINFEQMVTSYSTNNILSISPSVINAGVGDVLTITGENFGERGKVGFANANAGGFIETDVLDSQILTWTDTEITVIVPSIAGTGEVRVTKSDGTELLSEVLTVDYSVLNLNYNGDSYRTAHINSNTEGGYTWQFTEDFPTEAREAFIRTLETWQCETNMNWIIGEDTSVNARASDGINIVRFTNPNEVGSNNLGSCTSRYSGCVQSDGSIKWYVKELDIQFNVDKGWDYDGTPVTTQFDFGTVSLHELGHGRQLGHVVNKDAMMHYSLGNGDVKNELLSTDVAGSANIQEYSLSNTICNQPPYEAYSCTLGIDDEYLNSIILYPNPATNEINISKPYSKLYIYDITGKFIQTDVNISNLKSGIYFVEVFVDRNKKVFKLIKN